MGYNTFFLILTIILKVELLLLARRWWTLGKRWSTIESVFNTSAYEEPRRSYIRTTRHLLIFSVLGAICGNLFIYFWRYQYFTENRKVCQVPEEISAFAYMYQIERYHFALVIDYNFWIFLVLEIQYFMYPVAWILSLNLIIVLSVWLTARFDQLYCRIQKGRGLISERDWLVVFEHFQRLVDLAADVDQEIGLLILLACLERALFFCYLIFMLFRSVFRNLLKL